MWIVVVIFAAAVLVAAIVAGLRRLQARAVVPYWKEQHRRERRRALRGKGFGVDELAARLDTSASKLAAINRRYHRFTIPKKRGGTRTLHAPNPQLKHTQRQILRRLLKRLRPHEASMGFEPGYRSRTTPGYTSARRW